MLADAKAEVARLGEVALAQFVFLDLEATLKDFLGLSLLEDPARRHSQESLYLGASDRDVDGNLFVTTDTKGTDGVASLA